MSVLPSLNSIKPGVVILRDGEPYIVQTSNFLRMQQRKPVMQTKLRHLITGKTLEVSFHPGESVQEADLERVKANFLYHDHEGSHFMDNVSFEQFSFSDDSMGSKKDFLKEGVEVQILKFNGNPINVEISPKVRLKVTSAPPGVKGDSAGGVTKDIILENGLTIKAPLFIKEGEDVIVNTDTGEYVERAGDDSKK